MSVVCLYQSADGPIFVLMSAFQNGQRLKNSMRPMPCLDALRIICLVISVLDMLSDCCHRCHHLSSAAAHLSRLHYGIAWYECCCNELQYHRFQVRTIVLIRALERYLRQHHRFIFQGIQLSDVVFGWNQRQGFNSMIFINKKWRKRTA